MNFLSSLFSKWADLFACLAAPLRRRTLLSLPPSLVFLFAETVLIRAIGVDELASICYTTYGACPHPEQNTLFAQRCENSGAIISAAALSYLAYRSQSPLNFFACDKALTGWTGRTSSPSFFFAAPRILAEPARARQFVT